MKVKGLNHSSIKTKTLIRSEFAKMIKEKGELSKVTVTDLVKNIDISRGTFYSHYNSIDDVAKELQNEALELFNDNINSLQDVELFMDKIYLLLKNNNDLYHTILKVSDPMIFMERLNKVASDKLISFLNPNNSDKILKLNISVFIDGIINLYIKYYRDKLDCSLEEINNYSKKLFKDMFIKKSD